jgi:hypothetical protein
MRELNTLMLTAILLEKKIQLRLIKTLHVPSQHQLADIFTKALGSVLFHRLLSNMSILNIHHPS